jgi:hypothetical protein
VVDRSDRKLINNARDDDTRDDVRWQRTLQLSFHDNKSNETLTVRRLIAQLYRAKVLKSYPVQLWTSACIGNTKTTLENTKHHKQYTSKTTTISQIHSNNLVIFYMNPTKWEHQHHPGKGVTMDAPAKGNRRKWVIRCRTNYNWHLTEIRSRCTYEPRSRREIVQKSQVQYTVVNTYIYIRKDHRIYTSKETRRSEDRHDGLNAWARGQPATDGRMIRLAAWRISVEAVRVRRVRRAWPAHRINTRTSRIR